ncbi:transposase [Patescibacteria group bacterium]|nr:transposase [Patescibacteria group bacterium]MBU4056493.1 transposase [Patescibacteria group bacterium]
MITEKRETYKSDLTDERWNRIKALLPKPAKTGRPRCDDREAINGILYVLSTGCRWEDMPHDIDVSYQTSNRRLLEYQKRKVWQKIQGELIKEAYRKGKINLKNGYHDASVVKSKRGLKKKWDIQESIGLKA